MIPASRQKSSLAEKIHFRCDKELLPTDPAFADCFSDGFLGSVAPGGVDGPIATHISRLNGWRQRDLDELPQGHPRSQIRLQGYGGQKRV